VSIAAVLDDRSICGQAMIAAGVIERMGGKAVRFYSKR
jgi:hypothetical protein